MEPLLRGQTASRGWRGHPSCPAKSRAKPAPSPLSYPYRTHTQTSTNGTRPSTSVARDHPVTVRVTLRPTYGAAPLDPAVRDAVARARDHSRNSWRRAPTAGCTSTKPCPNLVSGPSGPQLLRFRTFAGGRLHNGAVCHFSPAAVLHADSAIQRGLQLAADRIMGGSQRGRPEALRDDFLTCQRLSPLLRRLLCACCDHAVCADGQALACRGGRLDRGSRAMADRANSIGSAPGNR